MKLHYPILFIVSLLLVVGCNNAPLVEELPTTVKCTFTLSASMPDSGDPSTRVAAWQLPDSKDIALKWKEGDKIQLYFKSGDAITQGDEVEVQNISTDGKKADFTVEVPSDISGGFDLYGVHGTASETTADGAILLDATPGNFVKLEDAKVPLFFKQEDVDPASPDQSVIFQHFGALQVITLRNTVNENITLENPSLVFSGDKWYHDATGNEYPLYDIVSGDPATKAGSSPSSSQPFTVEIAYNDNVKLAQWIMPNEVNPPEINFKAEINGTVQTSLSKAARNSPLVAGNAYHLYALWDGSDLTFTDEAAVQEYKITMTTSIPVNSEISLMVEADEEDQSDVWIDLDNNGVKDDGEGVTVFKNHKNYTITSQTVTLYGKVTNLSCSFNSLTALDVSNNTALTYLYCRHNDFTVLDVSDNTKVTYLDCYDCYLTTLDVSQNTALAFLDCGINSLTTLDVSKNTVLNHLDCKANSIRVLDVSHNTMLNYLMCYDNMLDSLDVSKNTALTSLFCCENNIFGTAMENLVKSLPVREVDSKGKFNVINAISDGNVCTAAQVQIAKDKNWEVLDLYDNPYPGS